MMSDHIEMVIYYGNTPRLFCIFIMFCFCYYKCSITDSILLENIRYSIVPGQYSHHKRTRYVDLYLSEFSAREVKLEVQECCSTYKRCPLHFLCASCWVCSVELSRVNSTGQDVVITAFVCCC